MGPLSTVIYLALAVVRVVALVFGLGMLPGVWVLWQGGLRDRAVYWLLGAGVLLGIFYGMPHLMELLRDSLGKAKDEGLWIAYLASGFFLVLLLPEPLRRARLMAGRRAGEGGRRRVKRRRGVAE
jgi:hypothetical protein